jgi:hypothetical protein
MKNLKTVCMLFIVALALSSFTPLPAIFFAKNSTTTNMLSFLVSWQKESVDFGNITQAKPVTANFEFTNMGNEPLLVSDVVASCGCTASSYSKAPILPGKSASITVTYNAANLGAFNKTVTVNFNDAGLKKILYIKGTVK